MEGRMPSRDAWKLAAKSYRRRRRTWQMVAEDSQARRDELIGMCEGLKDTLRSIATHGTTRPWAPGMWDDGDGYWRQVTHALIAQAAQALSESR